jgi:hypothetical protein
MGCGAAPKPVKKAPIDPAADPAYSKSVQQLVSMYREAASLYERDKLDAAGDILTKAQPIIERLIGVPRPTREAMEAASDLDQLYGRMLVDNHHFGWARMLFQKNQARWKNWTPQTEETARRYKLAVAWIPSPSATAKSLSRLLELNCNRAKTPSSQQFGLMLL